MITVDSFINYKFGPKDTLYGFKECIEAISKQFRCSASSVLYHDPAPTMCYFWSISNRPQGDSLCSGFATFNPDTRPFKAYLIQVVSQGGTIHFVLNNMTSQPQSGYHNISDGGRTFRHKLITVSELKFIARYYDVFFKGHVNFYLFNEAKNMLQPVPPLWLQREYPEWQQYYTTDSVQRAQRRREFSAFIAKIPRSQPQSPPKRYYGIL